MNWSDEVIKLLDDLGERFGVVFDWTQENVAPFISQLTRNIVTYKLVASILAAGLALAFVSTSIFLLLKENKRIKLFDYITARERNAYCGYFVNGGGRAACAILLILAVIGIAITFIVNLFVIVKCATLPELVIFECLKAVL